jgi:multidrug efflux pump subunit AcrA (membrane-fusion protein)
MEHTHKHTAPAVAARYLKRKLKRPLIAAAGVTTITLISGFSAFFPTRRELGPRPPEEVVATGIVESLFPKGVGAPFESTILQLAAQPGQSVKKGQSLFRLDTTGLKSQLTLAKAARAGAWSALQQVRRDYASDMASLRGQVDDLAAQYHRAQALANQPQPSADNTTYYQEEPNGFGTTSIVIETPATAPTADPGSLLAELEVAREALRSRERDWQPSLAAAREEVARADREVRHLQALIASADRKSPIDGVVTRVYAQAGETVTAHAPVVRVDDPKNFRVVVKVDQDTRERLKIGSPVELKLPAGQDQGILAKVENGEDKDLFYYYLWLKPRHPKAFQPGQQVKVELEEGLALASL